MTIIEDMNKIVRKNSTESIRKKEQKKNKSKKIILSMILMMLSTISGITGGIFIGESWGVIQTSMNIATQKDMCEKVGIYSENDCYFKFHSLNKSSSKYCEVILSLPRYNLIDIKNRNSIQ